MGLQRRGTDYNRAILQACEARTCFHSRLRGDAKCRCPCRGACRSSMSLPRITRQEEVARVEWARLLARYITCLPLCPADPVRRQDMKWWYRCRLLISIFQLVTHSQPEKRFLRKTQKTVYEISILLKDYRYIINHRLNSVNWSLVEVWLKIYQSVLHVHSSSSFIWGKRESCRKRHVFGIQVQFHRK